MPKWTKSQRQYIRFIIGDLSLRRFTEREIVQELSEKKPPIIISKTEVNRIKNNIEKQAEKWFTELRDSKYKYLSTYKDRIDSLFRYQKRLNDMFYDPNSKYDKIRIISELHSIELSIKNIYKEIPEIGIQSDVSSTTPKEEIPEPIL